MRKSIKLKLLALFIITLCVVICMSFFLHFTFFGSYYLHHMEQRLADIFLLVEDSLEEENLQLALSILDRQEEVSIVVVDDTLEYAVSSNLWFNEANQVMEQEFNELIEQERETLESQYLCQMIEGVDGPDCLVYVEKLTDGRYCILSMPIQSLENNMSVMTDFHVVAGILASLVGGIFIWIFANRFTRPIIEISQATEGLAQLDFNQRITYESDDELGHLATSIHILSEKLEENRAALQEEIAFQKVLTNNLSHELKTPIAVIRGYLEAITSGVADTKESQEEYMAVVISECDRMTELINAMLHLSKLSVATKETVVKEEFSAREFAQRIAEQSKSSCTTKGVALVQDIEEITLYGNQELLVHAFFNFVTNALKYGDGKDITMRLYEEGAYQLLSLHNTGKAIPERELARIFDVFYMVDKARSRELNSHGLGLSTAKVIVELHGGSIYCKQNEEGITFYIKIPSSS